MTVKTATSTDTLPKGASPFHVKYRHDHTLPDKTKYTEEKVIDSAQDVGILHMASQPGQHRYTVLAIKDAHYDFDSKSAQASKGLFSVEQEVFGKPTAGFRPTARLSYCVGQAFKTSSENTAFIDFVGQGPFEVDLMLGPTVSQPIYRKTVSHIKGNTWKVDLSDHVFSHVGSQILSIASVRDASGCPAEILNEDRLYLPIDVLETASITAVSDRVDYCVGEMLEFVLGGTYLEVPTFARGSSLLLFQEPHRGKLRESSPLMSTLMTDTDILGPLLQLQVQQEEPPCCRK